MEILSVFINFFYSSCLCCRLITPAAGMPFSGIWWRFQHSPFQSQGFRKRDVQLHRERSGLLHFDVQSHVSGSRSSLPLWYSPLLRPRSPRSFFHEHRTYHVVHLRQHQCVHSTVILFSRRCLRWSCCECFWRVLNIGSYF